MMGIDNGNDGQHQSGSPRKIYSRNLKCRNNYQNRIIGHGLANNHPKRALKPRICKLEHLEAKMASIEVSLSNGLLNDQTPIPSTSVQTNSRTRLANEKTNATITECGGGGIQRNERLQKFADEIERLQNRLYEKEAIICVLREQNSNQDATDNRNRVASDNSGTNVESRQLQQLQILMDNKLSVIDEIRTKLHSLEVNDLDSRIHQAELECLVEKEELNILNLQQEVDNIKSSSRVILTDRRTTEVVSLTATDLVNQRQQDNIDDVNVFSIVNCSQGACSLTAAEVAYDPSAPCFYVTVHRSGKGLFVQWANGSTKLKKGDRLLEVNGCNVIGFTKTEFLNVLKTINSNHCNQPLKMVVLRNSPILPVRSRSNKEIQAVDTLKEEISTLVNKLDTRIKENKDLHLSMHKLQKELEHCKEENLRLSHRNYYLEDQLSELSSQLQDIPEVESKNPPTTTTTTTMYANVPFNRVIFERTVDSDSGNYSGDSLDDAFFNLNKFQIGAGLLSRGKSFDRGCNQRVVPKMIAAIDRDRPRTMSMPSTFEDHGYVNLIDRHMRETVALGTSKDFAKSKMSDQRVNLDKEQWY